MSINEESEISMNIDPVEKTEIHNNYSIADRIKNFFKPTNYSEERDLNNEMLGC